MMAIAGIIVGKLRRTETTMYVLDLWPENLFSVLPIQNRFLVKLLAWVSHWHYRHVDKLIVLSQLMKQRLVENVGISPSKITVLPQACEKVYETDVDDKALAKRFKDGFTILFAGNISPAQSFETIIAAAVQLKQGGITDLNWVIVGDGMSRQWLENHVAKAGLGGSFYFEGPKSIDEIPKYTTVADLLIGCLVTSDLLEATVPAKVMSYLAAGKPMVLAMDGEVQSLINDEVKSGYAGPTGDAETLANNIEKIYRLTPKEREAMGKRGRAYHFKYFGRNLVLGKLYDFIMS
jgi:colanic acid biosynthesis glycosyl transferase WcaI